MAKNKIQFQKGLSLIQFFELYDEESKCRDQFFQWRWPTGFECPMCKSKEHCVLKTRELYLLKRAD